MGRAATISLILVLLAVVGFLELSRRADVRSAVQALTSATSARATGPASPPSSPAAGSPPQPQTPESTVGPPPESEANMPTEVIPNKGEAPGEELSTREYITKQERSAEEDPEIRELEERLQKIHVDPVAREAYYKELQETVDSIRSETPMPEQPESPPTQDRPRSDLIRYQDLFAPPASQSTIHASLLTVQKSVTQREVMRSRARFQNNTSHDASSRVIYWARKNGAPVPLALAVAYQESRWSLDPPRGSSGEVGVMQILPERCRLEGYRPSRLLNPEFNIWLGTTLLARYFAEEKSYARAAAKYVAGPGVFDRQYSKELREYIDAYAASVENYAKYFARYS